MFNYLYVQINWQIFVVGLYVFFEKLLCMMVEEVWELVVFVVWVGVVYGVSFVYCQFVMVQQVVVMICYGEVGRIFVVYGSYLQDWMLLEIDYNWWVDLVQGGVLWMVVDIGFYWCDIVQFMIGWWIVEVMVDLFIVWLMCKVLVNGKVIFSVVYEVQVYEMWFVDIEDFGLVLLCFDDGSKGSFMVFQVSVGWKNCLVVEINGSFCFLVWDQEVFQWLWIGYCEQLDCLFSDDLSLLWLEIVDSVYYFGGYIEGWLDVFKNMMGYFYQVVCVGKMLVVGVWCFVVFDDGVDVMYIIEVIVKSYQEQCWVSVEC